MIGEARKKEADRKELRFLRAIHNWEGVAEFSRETKDLLLDFARAEEDCPFEKVRDLVEKESVRDLAEKESSEATLIPDPGESEVREWLSKLYTKLQSQRLFRRRLECMILMAL